MEDFKNLNASKLNLQSQIDSITVSYYTSDINNFNASIVSLRSQIDDISTPDYFSDILVLQGWL
jgi:hypothetical protein